MKKQVQFPFPVFIATEGKWFVAECPILNIATQGKTEMDVKKNMKNLIEEYLNDPDTSKDQLRQVGSSSLSYIPVQVAGELLYGKS